MVRRGLQHLLTRHGYLARDADNADALVEEAERASTLFGRAVAGHPDPVSLARWLIGFRSSRHPGSQSIGWKFAYSRRMVEGRAPKVGV